MSKIQDMIDQIEEQQQECKEMLRKLDYLEEELYWHSHKRLDAYLSDWKSEIKGERLLGLLEEKEDKLCNGKYNERQFFSECNSAISKMLIELERTKEKYAGEFNTAIGVYKK